MTFHFFIPSLGKKFSQEFIETQKSIAKGKGKILIMDDEEQIRDLCAKFLIKLGYIVTTVENPHKLIDQFTFAEQQNKPYDLVILDLTIPGEIGGEKALKQLRKINSNILAIVSSGYSTDPIIDQYELYGFNGFLKKPYAVIELSDILEKVLNRGIK